MDVLVACPLWFAVVRCRHCSRMVRCSLFWCGSM